MKIFTISLHLLTAACLVTGLLSACVGPGITDPYIVAISRQKENLYYAPTSPNAPLLKKQYDLTGAFHWSSGSNYSSLEMQTAYMPGKHLGAITSYSVANQSATSNFKYNRLEAGLGYISNIDPYWHIESYAGYGTGETKNRHYTGTSKMRNNYFFLQPAIAVSNKKRTVQFAFVSKFAGNHFNVTDTSFLHDREPYSAMQITLLQNKPFQIFWEPGVLFRFGGDHVLFHIGYSVSKDLTSPDLYHSKNNFSLGVSVIFNAGNKNER